MIGSSQSIFSAGAAGTARVGTFFAAAVADRAKWEEEQSQAGAIQDSWALWIQEDHPCWCGDCPGTLWPISLPA